MSKIRIKGDTSGHYDLTVPDVSGTNAVAMDKIPQTDQINRFDELVSLGGSHSFPTDTTNPYIGRGANGYLELGARQTAHSAAYISMRTVGQERLRIDNSGYITTPNRPSFFVKDLNFTTGTSSYGSNGTILHNVGNHYATSGRFTAPVTGTYVFYGSLQMFLSGSTTYVGLEFMKNDVQYGIEYVSGIVTNNGHYNDHHTQSGMVVMYCTAGDYVNIEANRGARDATQNVFGGYLLG